MALRTRFRLPRGRWLGSVRHGLNERSSQNLFCAGMSKVCCVKVTVATFTGGATALVHSLAKFSIGVFFSSMKRCARMARQAGPALRWAAMAARRSFNATWCESPKEI